MSQPRGAATFHATAAAYDRHIGRYSADLARSLVDTVGPRPGDRALDVGCGPGALTAELVRRLGADHVAAVDPSPSFVAACAARLPGVDVRQAAAEDLPFADGSVDPCVQPARRQLHVRRAGRGRGDAPGRPRRAGGSPRRSGTTPAR